MITRGATTSLTAEWRQYAGGPLAPVSAVTITITNLATGAVAVNAAATTTPATGVSAYAWAVPGNLTPGSYLALWTGLDGQGDAVSASEILDVSGSATATLGGPYATLAQLKAQMGIADSNTTQDATLTRRLLSASADINSWTHRQFGRTEVATPRFFSGGQSGVDVHDFWTLDDFAITSYINGVVGVSAWDVSSLSILPLDGIVNQVPGWPYNRIETAHVSHPLYQASSYGWTVQVTAKWGWAAIPDNVVTSCLMLAVTDDKAKDAPFGVAGFGDYAVRIRQNPMVEEKLKDYVIDSGLQVAS